MADLSGFDASQHEEMRSYELLPEGKYLAMITESDMKDNSKGTGQLLVLVVTIIEGEHQGRKLWANLNLRHSNVDTVRLAQIELAAICKAVGVMTPKDSNDLHDRPMLITLKIDKRKDTGDLQNKISKYEPRNGASAPQQPAMAGAGANHAAPTKAPWAR